MKPEKVVFLGGLPRAGSTLLMNILGQNGSFTVTPTSGLVEVIVSMSRAFTAAVETKVEYDQDRLLERLYDSMREAIYGWFTGSRVVIDKSRGWLPHYRMLDNMFKDEKPKIIVPIRDLRGCVASMEKRYRARPDYRWDGENQNMVTVHQRVQNWMANPPLGMAAARIQDAIMTGVAEHMLFIRVEDLTTQPEKVMRNIYEYMGEDYHAHDFKNISQLTKENDAWHGPIGDHMLTGTEVHPIAEDWNEVLGEELSNAIVAENAWYYETFYPDRVKVIGT